jgi:hypothetical protein
MNQYMIIHFSMEMGMLIISYRWAFSVHNGIRSPVKTLNLLMILLLAIDIQPTVGIINIILRVQFSEKHSLFSYENKLALQTVS